MTIAGWIEKLNAKNDLSLTKEEQIELRHLLIELNGYWMVLEAYGDKRRKMAKIAEGRK